MAAPKHPKIYHILHWDRLPSVLRSGGLHCDATVSRQGLRGTVIGFQHTKDARQTKTVRGHPDIPVGQCVPFYFCPRSVMLYVIHMGNHVQLAYKGGQEPVIHLEADLRKVTEWADTHKKRWLFTLSNASSGFYEVRDNLASLDDINWTAVTSSNWNDPIAKEGKQAEFLLESFLPWTLIERVGVLTEDVRDRVCSALADHAHRPCVRICRDWYY